MYIFNYDPVAEQRLSGEDDDEQHLGEQDAVEPRRVGDARQLFCDPVLERGECQQAASIQPEPSADCIHRGQHEEGKARAKGDQDRQAENLDDVVPVLALDPQRHGEPRRPSRRLVLADLRRLAPGARRARPRRHVLGVYEGLGGRPLGQHGLGLHGQRADLHGEVVVCRFPVGAPDELEEVQPQHLPVVREVAHLEALEALDGEHRDTPPKHRAL
mmetsp:Transcript_126728/g.358505  ORF Transcript_126728/g.358505 Transcript_126728/m.358505 type:complete len:216 (-) Transcript_126728:550-1197(-)